MRQSTKCSLLYISSVSIAGAILCAFYWFPESFEPYSQWISILFIPSALMAWRGCALWDDPDVVFRNMFRRYYNRVVYGIPIGLTLLVVLPLLLGGMPL